MFRWLYYISYTHRFAAKLSELLQEEWFDATETEKWFNLDVYEFSIPLCDVMPIDEEDEAIVAVLNPFQVEGPVKRRRDDKQKNYRFAKLLKTQQT